MTDTYDKINHWYGWNGGECPVHPETEIDVMLACGEKQVGCNAREFYWLHDSFQGRVIIAFRITRLYVEPRKAREWWITDFGTGSHFWLAYGSREAVNEGALSGSARIIHVREVLEPTQ